MAQGVTKFLSGEFYRKIEERLDYASILVCWVFNVSAAFITFNMTLVFTSSGPLAVMYTLYVWAVTFAISNAYWIYWTQAKMKADRKTRSTISLMIAAMLVIGLFVIIVTIELIRNTFL